MKNTININSPDTNTESTPIYNSGNTEHVSASLDNSAVYTSVILCDESGDISTDASEDVAKPLSSTPETENDLYQCEKWLNHARECKEWCGKCEMGGKIMKVS